MVYPKSKENRKKQRLKQETKKEQERGSYLLERSGRAGEIEVHGPQLASGKLSEVQAESLRQTEERKSWKVQNKRKASSEATAQQTRKRKRLLNVKAQNVSGGVIRVVAETLVFAKLRA
jgi:hypothetical protein